MQRKYFGVMLDMSRNAVMKPSTLNKFVDYLSAFGYNMLQLYTEDTYEVKDEPYFGYLRGGYTKEEIQEIDAHCREKGVELIPCIQTLAHLRTIFKYHPYRTINDYDDILLIDEPRTYQLIENMFISLAESFSSRKVHIGMDEAHMVGLGKYLDKHGLCDRYELLNRHLTKVVEIAKKYGFEPMMWSDMFFRMGNNGAYYLRDPKLPKEAIEGVPDVALVYWDYYHTHKDDYRAMVEAHQKFGKEIWFAGGAWSWVGWAPANRYSLQTMKPAMDVCRENGVDNIFFTLWGDNGKECSYFNLLPSLYYLKRYYDGVKDRKQIAKEFEELTGEPFERMMDTDAPNYVGGNNVGHRDPSKYMLFNDPFFGWLDTTAKDGVDKEYKTLARRFANYAKSSENFGYLYDMFAKLCKALSYKYSLGVRAREAYQVRDEQALKGVLTDFKKAEKAIYAFYESFRTLWHIENKPHGFEVQDMRLGGLMQRMRHCRERLERYLKGEETTLPELEIVLLDFWGNGRTSDYDKATPGYNYWGGIITQNQLN